MSNSKPMRVGILTGGGDCPGLNAVIRAVVRKGEKVYGDELLGFHDGWRGVMDGEYTSLDIQALRGTLPLGGTILGTSRIQPYATPDGLEKIRTTMADLAVDAIIAIGGEGTLSCTRQLFRDGFPVVGVPKTIDNDIAATERTFGFDTAVAIATEAIGRLHTTAESHNRVMVVEVMGRHVGHIAVWAGIAGGATITLIPEEPFDIDEVCEALRRRHEGGKYASIVVVAEGAKPLAGTFTVPEDEFDEFGHIRLGGHRQPGCHRDREADRFRDPGHDPRARAAWRDPDCVRSGTQLALRHCRHRGGARRRVRSDGCAAVERNRPRVTRGGHGRTQAGECRTLGDGQGILSVVPLAGRSGAVNPPSSWERRSSALPASVRWRLVWWWSRESESAIDSCRSDLRWPAR